MTDSSPCIAILGTGLIGGSLGLAWTQRRPDATIIGHDRPDVLDRAYERGAIHERAADPITAVESADVVVFATPLGTTLRLMEDIGGDLTEGTVVTDVASVKTPVMEQAKDAFPDTVHFIGGHPMAGSASSGIDAADDLLFENAAYVVCLPDGVDESELSGSLSPAIDLIEATGAHPLVLRAARHDRIAAWVSHLPQLLAVVLMNVVDDLDDDMARQLAAGGFRDMTRIASSPFSMWRDVIVGNQGQILDALGDFARAIQSLRNRLIEDDVDALNDAFDQSRAARSSIPRDRKGFLQPLYDILVRAPDRPGELHAVTGVLAEKTLNVKDVELLKFREGTGGTFRLGFDDADTADAAVDALNASDYEARRLD